MHFLLNYYFETQILFAPRYAQLGKNDDFMERNFLDAVQMLRSFVSFSPFEPFSIIVLEYYHNRFCICDTKKDLQLDCIFIILFYDTPFNSLQIECNLKMEVIFLCSKVYSHYLSNSFIISQGNYWPAKCIHTLTSLIWR